jgi:hypothetical protein
MTDQEDKAPELGGTYADWGSIRGIYVDDEMKGGITRVEWDSVDGTLRVSVLLGLRSWTEGRVPGKIKVDYGEKIPTREYVIQSRVGIRTIASVQDPAPLTQTVIYTAR